MTANNHIKAFVERILRLKGEQDALSADIREIYAEAKSMGFDKTALGQVVSIVRKREKDSAKFDELNAIVDLYLAAVDGGTSDATRAHAHEATSSAASTPASNTADQTEAAHG